MRHLKYTKKKVALVYDRVNKWGGAERVLLTLHEMFPDAPLYTSVYDEKNARWARVFPKIHTSFLQKIPFAKSNHEFLAFLMPLAFESFDFSSFDLVISVTSEAAKGIKTRFGTLHICYCLTPTRYLWSHYDTYFKGLPFKGMATPFVNYLRKWDKKASKRPDLMIAISTEVQKRIKKYYGRKSEIIFPSVNVPLLRYSGTKKGKYYLIVGRLVGYKRVDLAIKTFNKLKLPLVVIGDGWQKWKLKLMAGKNIKFVYSTSDNALLEYYKNAKALVMPQEEDFGIVSVEAQAAGTPVIAFNKGGAKDTVVDGKTGVFFDKQTVASLTRAIAKFGKMVFNHKYLVKNAQRFSKEVFKKEFLKHI